MKEDWDIFKYRNKFEPEEQWELKRKFMETHKHLFPKERVLCLAQVLVNMEFLGAKYPVETMRVVEKLSKNILKEFREKQKTKLQRTFVEASSAASAKIRGFQLASTPKCVTGKNTAGLNERYFMAAILSSNAKNIAENGKSTSSQEDSTLQNSLSVDLGENGDNTKPTKKKKKKKKKILVTKKNSAMNAEPDQSMATMDPAQILQNPPSAYSGENSSNVEPTKKKKRKKKTCAAEKNSAMNAEPDQCMATMESALMLQNLPSVSSGENSNSVESTKKKKKRKKQTQVAENNSAINADSDQCIATVESAQILPHLPSACSGENSNNVESTKKKRKKKTQAAENNTVINAELDQYMATMDPAQISAREEALVQPPIKKLKSVGMKDNALPRIPNFVIIMLQGDKKKFLGPATGEAYLTPRYQEIIGSSARLSSVSLEVEERFLKLRGLWESVLHLGGREITSSLHENPKMSRKSVYQQALLILQDTHYQIVVTDKACSSVTQFLIQVEDDRQAQAKNSTIPTITKDVMEKTSNASSDSPSNGALGILSKAEKAVEEPFNSTVAVKMMKMMGWTEGTGLGIKKQGIVEPIKSHLVVNRKGIGYNGSGNTESFGKLVHRYLTNYNRSSSLHTIIFSSEFSNEQREHIHGVAHRMGMESKSVGKHPNRQLTVRRFRCKIPPLIQLLDQLVESDGADPLFERLYLIPPQI